MRDGKNWVMAVYFPRGQQGFAAIQDKFITELAGANKNGAHGIIFVTNQETRLSERNALAKAAGSLSVELYHLERITAVLDQPSMTGLRSRFLSLDDNPTPVAEKWVNSDYLDKSGIAKRLEAEGYRCSWIDAHHENERVDLEGWEYVEVEQPYGPRVRLKIRDSQDIGGYLVLLKKRDPS